MKGKVFMFAMVTMFILTMFVLTGSASALTDDEYKIIQKAADEYLSAVPPTIYLLMPNEVLERIQSGKKDFVIVDVRMPKEQKYDQGHVPGAIYIGLKTLLKPENLAKLPKDKDIIVYCNIGAGQGYAISILRMLGYKAYGMRLGYMSWKTTVPDTGLTLKAIGDSVINNYPVEK